MTIITALAASAALAPAPAPAPEPTPRILEGIASWYSYFAGQAAAGPALRDALGPDWRGSTVRVCAGAACVAVRLTDWCYCWPGTATERLIDLDVRSVVELGLDPARGLYHVTVERLP